MTARRSGRGWAYLGAALGGAVSVAANVAHSYVRPADAPDGWTPDVGAVIGSVFWPVALFVAVEILARVAWPRGRGWALLRFGGLLPVAAVAALVSYRHLSGLLTHYGEDGVTATLGPLAVDGLMLMATGALLATGRTAPPAPREKFSDGLAAPTLTRGTPEASTAVLGATPAPARPAVAAPRPPVIPPGVRMLPVVAVGTVPDVPDVPDTLSAPPTTAARVSAVLAETPAATPAQVAARLGVSERTARRYMPAANVPPRRRRAARPPVAVTA